MKPYYLIFSLLVTVAVSAQEPLSLEDAYSLATNNYPVIRQKQLVRQTENITLSNLQKGFLPQVTLSGQATYQSDVTSVPVKLPGVSIEDPAKDQYRVVADINQLLFDGGVIKQQKTMETLNARVEEEKTKVELYQLRDRINQLFLGVLYMDEQLRQVELVKTDIQNGIDRLTVQVDNGVAFKSSVSMLKAEWIKADQRRIELVNTRTGLLDALSLFVGRELPATQKLLLPLLLIDQPENISRPELRLYESQGLQINHVSKLITAKNLPKVSLFAQSGYGRPGLNMLQNDFDFYYLGGIRFNWSLGGLYTKKKERQQVTINKQLIDVKRETFLLNTKTQLKQQRAEIRKLEELILSDKEIIELRASVKTASKAQLDNAVITPNDYLKEVNAEDQARQSLITHELQLLQAKINYQTILGTK